MSSAKVSYPTRTREEVVASLREQVGNLADRFPVERAVLFGSYATGDYTVASDVDLLVVYRPGGDEDAFRSVKRSVDLRGLEPHVVSAQEYRRRRAHFERMTRDGVLIYERGDAEGP